MRNVFNAAWQLQDEDNDELTDDLEDEENEVGARFKRALKKSASP